MEVGIPVPEDKKKFINLSGEKVYSTFTNSQYKYNAVLKDCKINGHPVMGPDNGTVYWHGIQDDDLGAAADYWHKIKDLKMIEKKKEKAQKEREKNVFIKMIRMNVKKSDSKISRNFRNFL